MYKRLNRRRGIYYLVLLKSMYMDFCIYVYLVYYVCFYILHYLVIDSGVIGWRQWQITTDFWPEMAPWSKGAPGLRGP